MSTNKTDEDDYWSSSRITALSFDFDDDSKIPLVTNRQFERLGKEVRADLTDDEAVPVIPKYHQQPNQMEIPLHSLISDEVLLAILAVQSGDEPSISIIPSEEVRMLRRKVHAAHEPPEPDEVLCRLLLGRSCVLENCRSLKSKTNLLDAALELGDGDAITMIVIWLKKTLKQKTFYHLLSTRPAAAQQYICHLATRCQDIELSDILKTLGKIQDASMLNFQLVVSRPINNRLSLLRSCYTDHFAQPGTDSHTTILVNRYISLLEWQSSATSANQLSPPVGSSVIQSVMWSCTEHWASQGIWSPLMLAEQQKIAPMQFDWTALEARAALGQWADVETLIVKKGWLKNRQISTQVPLEKVILRLHSMSAPQEVLDGLVNLLPEPKKTKISRAICTI